jgi:hypothetical protein
MVHTRREGRPVTCERVDDSSSFPGTRLTTTTTVGTVVTRGSNSNFIVVYYESIKRELKRRLVYEYRCDERLKLKMRNLHSSDTGLVVELEHLKTKTR